MVTVAQASEIILNNCFTPRVKLLQLSEAVGSVLADAIGADRDFPPFNRVGMDGIALNYGAWEAGSRTFKIEGRVAAGEPQTSLRSTSACIEVMTGAVLPEGCDTVIRYEDLEFGDGEASIRADSIQRWQSVHVQGADAKKGEAILQPGQKLGASEIAVLASVGKTEVPVFQCPAIAVISTGDELVSVDEVPAPWQIRSSNAWAILASLREMGFNGNSFHLPDDSAALKRGLESIVAEHDILILSGGVSKGKFDFVPDMLEAVGIKKLFHQVSQRPGKPFWFGAGNGKIAFALPGNPVSTFMCFCKYIRPWILRSLGVKPEASFAVLGKDFSFPQPVTYFLQASIKNERGTWVASPVPGGGSGDFANLRHVDGFLELPLERTDFKAGEVFQFIGFRH